MLPPFVLNDETKKNSHGFFLVNAGGRLERFNDNPVMLDHHVLDKLIGKWQNLRVDGHKLIADPDFDEGTTLGAERKGQVDRGYLKGASPGIIPLAAEYRDNQIAGECDLYVTDWELIEGSIASVPSNAGALSLVIYGPDNQPIADKDIKLHMDKIVQLSAKSKSQNINVNKTKMEKINLTAEALVALGISDGADAAAISAAILKLSKDKADLAAKVDTLEADAVAAKTKAATDMVELAIKEGRLPADKKESFIKLATTNPDLAKETLEALPAKASLSAAVSAIKDSVIPADRQGWTHLQWLKNDPEGLKKLKIEQPEVFEAITKKRK